jgi:ATP-dependent helicase HrpB
MSIRLPTLPVTEVLPLVCERLRTDGLAVLEAPPGAGKSTLVPLALLSELWLEGGILMLEPRRVAARATAQRMASLLGEKPGERVGWRMRMETRVSPHTRITVVTEGVLIRMLQRDPSLEGTSVVIFDEVHERSLATDAGLALTLQHRTLLRPDLRVLLMSATLDDTVRALAGERIVRCEGRVFDVTTRYLQRAPEKPLDQLVRAAVTDALHDQPGDVLVFLPGAAEIRRAQERLRELHDDVDVLILHGDSSPEDQERALRDAGARRRVILSTALAETSVTIDGVRTVIDAGLSREPRYDLRSGMTRLVTVPASFDAADQRRGRAGRTATGLCIRLWTEADHALRTARRQPEILSADCAPLVLDLAVAGWPDPYDLPWLDPPPRASVEQAREVLHALDALDEHDRATPHGEHLTHVGAHPRIAHAMVLAAQRAWYACAAEVAAVLGERDVLRGETRRADIGLRLDAIRGTDAAARSAQRRVHFWQERLRTIGAHREHQASDVPADPGVIIAWAYPERIARRREDGRFVMRSGRTARVYEHDPLASEEWLAIAELDGVGNDLRIALAAPLTRALVEREFESDITDVVVCEVDESTGRVRSEQRRTLGAIVLHARAITDADARDAVRTTLAQYVREHPELLTPDDAAQALQERIAFARRYDDSIPDRSITIILSELDDHLHGVSSLSQVRSLPLADIILQPLSWEQRKSVDALAPATYETPTKRVVRIDYSDVERPTISVRLQDMFGVNDTPRVGGGRQVLTVALLSPAGRPIQITQDLGGFWNGSYAEVRKEMKGRYPKHQW